MVEIIFLSIVQGVTEFLPVSSSSHLVIASKYMNFKNQSLLTDVSLHIGSFLAVIAYFYKEILNFVQNKDLFLKILISSIPVMIAGFILIQTGFIEKIRNVEVIGWTTLLFGVLLFISDKFQLKKNLKKDFDFKAAMFIGCFQILSLIPGVSRSGITITAARFLNFNRVDSLKISFLLSIPTLVSVSIYGLKNIFFSSDKTILQLNLISIFLSFVFSYLTIKFFLDFIKKYNLNIFVFYRVVLGVIIIFSNL